MSRFGHILRNLAVLTALCLISFSGMASAHVLKQDNGVNAVLHIAPFDAPTSNDPTRIEIEFSNTAGTFSLGDYSTKLQLVEADRVVHTYTVGPEYFGTTAEGLATITFPSADVYSLNLVGTPTSTGTPPFSMQYEVRVTPGAGSAGVSQRKDDGSEVLLIGGAAVIVFAMVAARQIIAGKRYSNKDKLKSKEEKHV